MYKRQEVLSDVQPWYAFRLYWNGDLYEETFERHILETWNGSAMSRIYPREGKSFGDYGKMCDGDVHYPNLLADLFGDWREEIVLWNDSELVIMTSNVESDFRVPTLMHDHVYRMGVAWQNAAYNQPPHLGYYLPDSFGTRYVFMTDGAFEQTVSIGDSISEIKCRWKNSGAPTLLKSIAPDGTVTEGGVMDGFTFKRETLGSKTFTLSGKPSVRGDYKFVLRSGKNVVDGSERNDTITIHSVDPTDVKSADAHKWVSLSNTVFDDCLVLSVNIDGSDDVTVSIYNASGAEVFRRGYVVSGKTSVPVYGMSHLNPGIYVLKVMSSAGAYGTKVVKR